MCVRVNDVILARMSIYVHVRQRSRLLKFYTRLIHVNRFTYFIYLTSSKTSILDHIVRLFFSLFFFRFFFPFALLKLCLFYCALCLFILYLFFHIILHPILPTRNLSKLLPSFIPHLSGYHLILADFYLLFVLIIEKHFRPKLIDAGRSGVRDNRARIDLIM